MRLCLIPYSHISYCNPVFYSVLPSVSLQNPVVFRTPMILSVQPCFIPYSKVSVGSTLCFPYSHGSVCKTVLYSVLPCFCLWDSALFRSPKYLVCSSLCFFVLPNFYLVQPSFFRIPLFLSVILLVSRYSHVCSLQCLVFFRTPMVLTCKTELFPYSHVSVCESVLYSVLPSI